MPPSRGLSMQVKRQVASSRVPRLSLAMLFCFLLPVEALLAVVVNPVELLCTAGLPAMYQAARSQQSLSAWGHFGYLDLYNFGCIADEDLIMAAVVWALGNQRLQRSLRQAPQGAGRRRDGGPGDGVAAAPGVAELSGRRKVAAGMASCCSLQWASRAASRLERSPRRRNMAVRTWDPAMLIRAPV